MDLDNDGEMGDGAWEAGKGAARQPGAQRLQMQRITDGSHRQRERDACQLANLLCSYQPPTAEKMTSTIQKAFLHLVFPPNPLDPLLKYPIPRSLRLQNKASSKLNNF